MAQGLPGSSGPAVSELFGPFHVGDRTGYLEDAVVGARGQPLLRHGALQQAFAVGRQLTVRADLA